MARPEAREESPASSRRSRPSGGIAPIVAEAPSGGDPRASPAVVGRYRGRPLAVGPGRASRPAVRPRSLGPGIDHSLARAAALSPLAVALRWPGEPATRRPPAFGTAPEPPGAPSRGKAAPPATGVIAGPAAPDPVPGRQRESVPARRALSDQESLVVRREAERRPALAARPAPRSLARALVPPFEPTAPLPWCGRLGLFRPFRDEPERGVAFLAIGFDRPVLARAEGERGAAFRALRPPFDLNGRRGSRECLGARSRREGRARNERERVAARPAGPGPQPDLLICELHLFSAIGASTAHGRPYRPFARSLARLALPGSSAPRSRVSFAAFAGLSPIPHSSREPGGRTAALSSLPECADRRRRRRREESDAGGPREGAPSGAPSQGRVDSRGPSPPSWGPFRDASVASLSDLWSPHLRGVSGSGGVRAPICPPNLPPLSLRLPAGNGRGRIDLRAGGPLRTARPPAGLAPVPRLTERRGPRAVAEGLRRGRHARGSRRARTVGAGRGRPRARRNSPPRRTRRLRK